MPEAQSLNSTSLHLNDLDPTETREWLDALEAVIENEGSERAHYLIERLVDKARRSGDQSALQSQYGLHQHDPAA